MARILIVDDEMHFRKMIGVYIELSFKASFEFAKDGEEGLIHAEDQKFDLICTDFKMPKKTGAELIQAIRTGDSPNRDTPIIMITGYIDIARPSIDKLKEKGVYLMDKPFKEEKLMLTLKKILKNPADYRF